MTRREFTSLLSGTAAALLALPSASAAACMNSQSNEEVAKGHLALRNVSDGSGRRGTAYILTLPRPRCLDGAAPDEKVAGARSIHIFSSNEGVRARIGRFVGTRVQVRGTVFPRHTVHHHAPIVMDITEIDEI